MSLYGSMFSGVSGLNAQSQALGMISDNISNVNTVGYKTTSAAFSTLVTRRTVAFHAPGGVRSTPLASVDRQGLLQASPTATHVAISGAGFFVVTDTDTPQANDTRFYTRAGQFTADAGGFLRSPTGLYLNGWRTDNAGVPLPINTSVLTSLEPVRVSAASGSAIATTQVEVAANLPASAPIGQQEITNAQIFDSLGVAHDLVLTWDKVAANDWNLTVSVPEVPPPAVTFGANPVLVRFNGDGTPQDFDVGNTGGLSPQPPLLNLTGWSDGALPSNITLNLGTPGPVGTAVPDGLTQFSSNYSVAFINQDGVQFGNFIGVSVDDKGLVTALYDNGETLKIYKLPIATFPNPNGLDQRSGTAFSQSAQSGDFVLRAAGDANAGELVPSALEASTSDLATEFTNMIITQRAYAASARVITTADDMLEELIRIKR